MNARTKHSTEDVLRVIKYSTTHTVEETAAHFKINPTLVSSWRQKAGVAPTRKRGLSAQSDETTSTVVVPKNRLKTENVVATVNFAAGAVVIKPKATRRGNSSPALRLVRAARTAPT